MRILQQLMLACTVQAEAANGSTGRDPPHMASKDRNSQLPAHICKSCNAKIIEQMDDADIATFGPPFPLL